LRIAFDPTQLKTESPYRWIMVGFAAVTCVIGIAMPMTSLSVLLPDVAADFGLSPLQMGILWATSSVTGMIIGLFAGSAGDRFGTRITMIVLCIGTAIFGALRGFSGGFWGFFFASFMLGIFQPALPIIAHKLAGEWFPRNHLGLANGIVAMGFALGLTLGAFLGAAYLSPWLGGWENVLIFYGVMILIIGILWALIHPADSSLPFEQVIDSKEPFEQVIDSKEPFEQVIGGKQILQPAPSENKPETISLRQGFGHVMRLRNLWIIALGAMGVRAGFAGFSGYLPTYLQTIGWTPATAGNALSIFFLVSLVGVIPLSMLSDKLQTRRGFLIFGSLLMGIGFCLLSVVDNMLIWGAVIIAGLAFDGFMSIYTTAVLEVKGVGMLYAGTALGFAGLIRNIGGIVSPPLGNSLASFGPSIPFAFWGVLTLLSVAAFWMLPPREIEE